MSVPLIAPKSLVEGHLRSIGRILDEGVDSAARVQLSANWNIEPLVAGIVGEGCETIGRNRGLDAPVAPMLLLHNGMWAWLGYREEWDSEPAAGKTQRFSFRSAGLSVHFGYKNVRHKPQMFRAEWSGWARWGGKREAGYQGGNAAHPHWQFDALESLKPDSSDAKAATFLEILKSEGAGSPAREFSPGGMTREDVSEMIGVQELSRIHFASAAMWWNAEPHDLHAHSPKTAEDIQKWVRQTLAYIRNELRRLQSV